MTFNVGTIQGGTRAGWRLVQQAPKDWDCHTCMTTVRKFFVNCPDCGGHRDGAK